MATREPYSHTEAMASPTLSTKESDYLAPSSSAPPPSQSDDKEGGAGTLAERERQDEEEKLRFDVFSRVPPLLIIPARLEPSDEPLGSKKHPARAWLPEHLLSSPWLTLFYDLLVVAVLNVFSSRHELVSSAGVGIYFSYFVIIWYLWMSQTAYDIRFQAADAYHRFCKLMQICVFIYIGAASGGWSPTDLYASADPLTDQSDAVIQASAQRSFQMVSVAYSISRGILAFQYLFLIAIARLTRRPKASLVVPLIGVTFSLIFAVIAATLPQDSQALAITKPTMLYLGIAGEAIAEVLTTRLASFVRPSAESLSERLGALTLIILGEGFVNILKAFSEAIVGFTQIDGLTYLKCFSAIVISYLIYVFSFEGFNTRHYVGKRRALIWTLLHMPFHFVLLLFFSATVTAIRFRAFSNGSTWAVGHFLPFAGSTGIVSSSEAASDIDAPGLANELSVQLGKLPLKPAWPLALARFEHPNLTLPEQELFLLQYTSQIVVLSAASYGVVISNAITAPFDDLLSLTALPSQSSDQQNEAIAGGTALFKQILGEVMTSALAGVVWIFPSAGGTLFCIGILNAIRYQFGNSPIHFYDISQIVAGAALALVGLTSLGPKKVVYIDTVYDQGLGDLPTAPIFQLVRTGVVLPIIASVYALFWFVTTVALIVQKRHQVGALVHEVGEDDFEDEVEPPGGVSVLGRAVSRPMPNG